MAAVFWGQQAQLAEQLLKKGQLVYVEGWPNTTNWTDWEDKGFAHYRSEVAVESFLVLTPKDAPISEVEAQL